ncbi:hypothetical protein [Streptomyces albireticuli]|uniref:Uncharacterized protein n=1 Tax=Streptomyces albireticuli TaxID=1940 RepID=A0A2A2D9B6_9ACTN|nr:hypothetical protein [Streptomyces albireticuli]MCD9145899.1 hypothetical protein [Streptomyces albireticuli]MCD9166069.1 hypothetical protein [Streptomyces albireticuli]MCD9196349.1 hypothetical protein [Streptomyces albireticuli]PAU47969.1 hypothetical protein CK936_15785 [Streptomyces albireticuli]
MTLLFGPHCPHDECSWLGCDVGEGDENGIVYPCRNQAECPYCGDAPMPPQVERPSWTCPECGALTLGAGTEEALAAMVARYGQRHLELDHGAQAVIA